VFLTPNFFLVTQIHNDEDVDDDTAVVVFTAPIVFLVTRMHDIDDEDDNMRRMIILHHSLCLRHQDSFWIHNYTSTRMILRGG